MTIAFRKLEDCGFVKLTGSVHGGNSRLRLRVILFVLKAGFVLRIFGDGSEHTLNLITALRAGQGKKARTHRLGGAQQQLPK